MQDRRRRGWAWFDPVLMNQIKFVEVMNIYSNDAWIYDAVGAVESDGDCHTLTKRMAKWQTGMKIERPM